MSLFDIRNNHLEGTLPDGLLHNAAGLETLSISHNNLTGTIAELRLSGWADLNGKGCDDYNVDRCLNQGQNQNGDGVNAIEACCQCDGGTANIPSVMPSNKYDPSATPSANPTDCYDYIDWVDENGNECDDYDTLLCLTQGQNQNNYGINAIEACCHCGGGTLKLPSSTPSRKYNPSTTPSAHPTGCYDFIGWVDDNGNECDD